MAFHHHGNRFWRNEILHLTGFCAGIMKGTKNNGKKGALYSSLLQLVLILVHFVSKDLNIAVSYLARSCMIERKLLLLSFESSSLDPRKGKLHFACINVTFTSPSKTFCQKFVFPAKTRTTLLLSPCFSIAHI